MTSAIKHFFFLFMVLIISACAKQPTQPIELKPYKLGAGDTVRIIVLNEESLTNDFTINSEGNLSLPLVGKIPAADKTTSELEKDLTTLLEKDYLRDPSVNVEVAAYRDIYVIGEVNKPGNYPFVPHLTGLKAVAIAGGYTPHAEQTIFEVRRNIGNRIETIEVSPADVLEPGDTVIISRRWF